MRNKIVVDLESIASNVRDKKNKAPFIADTSRGHLINIEGPIR